MSSDVRLPSHGILGRAFPLTQLEPRAKLAHTTSILDVYQDTATRDKFIFPSSIIRILCHFSIPIHNSAYYTTMSAIDAGSVWRSEAQFRLKRPHVETTGSAASTIPSMTTPFSSTGVVTLEVITVQLSAWMLAITLSLMGCVG